MTSPTTSANTVSPSLRHAFGGIWRLTLPGFCRPGQLLRLAGILLAIALLTLVSVRTSDPSVFFDCAIRYVTFLVPMFAFISAGGAIRDALKPDTADYVFTRPIPRPAYLVFKYVAYTAGLQATALTALGVLFSAGAYRHVPGLWAAAPLLLLAQVLAIGVFAAFGFLCGTLTARHLVVGIVYAGVVEIGIGSIPTQLNRLSLIHHLKALLQPIAAQSAVPAQSPIATAALLLVVTAAMLALAGFVFGLRELAGARPKES